MGVADAPFTHLDERGRARMVDVTAKQPTRRRALARCAVLTAAPLPEALAGGPDSPDVMVAARLAGVQAAKQTSQLIPLCHPIPLTDVEVELAIRPGRLEVAARTVVVVRTGVEMEALTACTVAGLTIVRALLGVDPGAQLSALTLWYKAGGRSGTWVRSPPAPPAP